ncbi:AzlC family ABC transporter permease [Lonepinella koalarum]|uniref:4-azaleucine resistance transporter AzlC n=2 Tax=Lonepinella koalarum TaxID=53417 RepID=A0A4R1KR64_9PAST|nr:AzlC family ABC transporter permease [Lonepinella koalarum]MDH2926639.1 branched-chain amino acid transporter AzlC [Lonepinella koalarum]TCK66960.1 4-azaleucine resistance transporter AzlC [Lonepinella koalarum]TFJ88965.1 branched-chain amino acid transporter AzlC [Lonepinella koalarum]
MTENKKSAVIWTAAKAAFPYSVPMIIGYIFLGIAYGIYMKVLGFGVWFPFFMAALIYAGSVEFIVATSLTTIFSPLSVLLVTLMVSGRQVFYSISMLEKYGKQLGKKRWYLISAMSDEAFSLNYMANVPEHLDKGWYYFFVSLYLQVYWVIGAVLGNLSADIVPFSLKGIEFAMTALFIVIFAENWLKEKSHESSLLGLGITLFFLITIGKEHFLIPTLFAIWGVLTLRRTKLESKIIRLTGGNQ